MIRHLDLFSGIGGFALAFRWTGAGETVGFCELDPWCQRVLAKNFPGVPIHDDIKTLTGDALARFGRIDFITGGFPCQPFSAAGRRTGKEDDRYLWPAMAAVIAECRPAYVMVENSPRIREMVLDDVCDDLAGLGYAVGAIDVPAGALGAPHRRHRMWTLAHLDRGRELQPAVPGKERRNRTLDGTSAVVTDPRSQRYGASIESVCARRDAVVPRLGRPSGPGVVGTLHGIPNRVDRVRGLGNAIVPQVAYELMRVMFADEMEQAA